MNRLKYINRLSITAFGTLNSFDFNVVDVKNVCPVNEILIVFDFFLLSIYHVYDYHNWIYLFDHQMKNDHVENVYENDPIDVNSYFHRCYYLNFVFLNFVCVSLIDFVNDAFYYDDGLILMNALTFSDLSLNHHFLYLFSIHAFLYLFASILELNIRDELLVLGYFEQFDYLQHCKVILCHH